MRSLLCLLCLAMSACVTVRSLQIEPIDADPGAPVFVDSPVKVHLVDGSTVVFEKGIMVADRKVRGEGFRYDITLELREPITELPLDDVAAMESFQTPVHTGATAAATTGATVGGGIGGFAALKFIFGSCPTTYSLQDGEPVLEAESFSYSIAPGFEMRDVDRLGLDPGSRGRIELEIRNEALETHYINQVELLSVEHGSDEVVYTDHRSRPVVLHEILRAPLTGTDNSGYRVDESVAHADGVAWRSPDARLASIGDTDFRDWMEFGFAAPTDDRQSALVLRLRNSLLNTVLLYDVMLSGQGLGAIDWMGDELTRLGPRYRLARWYNATMGMQVQVWQDGRWKPIAVLPDTGPIAWKEVAIPLPQSHDETIRVKLGFVADNWRVDRVALGSIVDHGRFRRLALSRIVDRAGAAHEAAVENLRRADRRYVITKPGDHLLLQFDSGVPRADRQRTFFLAAQGYYIEWMRREWLDTSAAATFVPGDAAVVDAVRRWRLQRDDFRARFDATRINTR